MSYTGDVMQGLGHAMVRDSATLTSFRVTLVAGSVEIGSIDGTGTQGSAVDDKGLQAMAEAKDFDGSALPNAVDEGDAVRIAGSLSGVQYVMVVDEDGSGRPAYDSGTDSFKSFEVSPLSSQHVEETLADVTSETNATTNRFIDMDGVRYLGLQFEKTGGADSVTLTLQATLQDDGTAPASITDYQDVTTALTGSASFTADTIILVDTPLPIKWLRVQTVSAGGGNDADYAIYSKILY